MIFLAVLLVGIAVWNFIVGVWIMGLLLLGLAAWSVIELFVEDDDYWY